MLEFYPTQAKIISKTRKAIQDSKSVCIDSPTGTGKTRSILLSILPFLDPTKTNIGSSIPITSLITLNNLEFIINSESYKIFYVSRTHSQLNQVLEEIRNINILHNKDIKEILININAIVLGNRQLYCSVYEGDIEEINNKCKNGECEYKEMKKYYKGNSDFTNFVISLYDSNIKEEEIENIEPDIFGTDSFFKIPKKKRYLLDTNILNKLADAKNKQNIMKNKQKENIKLQKLEVLENSSNFCAFYFTKHFVETTPLTLLTYSSILNLFTRESYKLNLDNSIIIFDEAHNLFDMLIDKNSVQISYFILKKFKFQLEMYNKTTNSNKNKKEISQTLKDLNILITNILKIEDILKNKFIESNLNNLKLFINNENKNNPLLLNYKDESSIILSLSITEFQQLTAILDFNTLPFIEFIRKISYFNNKIETEIFEFLRLLTDSNTNCRVHIIFYESINKESFKLKEIKIFPLDPSIYFKPFIKAKSILFTGGTMEPHTLLDTLIPNIEILKGEPVCNNFLPLICTHYKEKELKITYKNKDKIINPIKLTLEEFISIKANSIIFFTSKEIMKLFENIKTNKKIFINDFEGYKTFINELNFNKTNNNAVLLTVLGGSLSEGINFSDNLCRLIIIIGIPFPTPKMDLYERNEYFKEKNIDLMKCMAFKIVNQALGRALRHKNDWASMILIDSRYKKEKENIVSWIGEKIKYGNVNECKKMAENFISYNEGK